ncbi:hypothetical protein A5745_13330 [Mycobacterium sp. IS-2888]|uniref:DUF7159 family protein n=1 Tax=Mycobacterium sp. IS-2888 TaxID=1834159 RepID=UPI00096EBC90|nr:hypothetical protein [Mycobacterium sp. IS-2888]OMC46062.1 hypothetical protein A5745_13330 [Mycobacterium sp. IS-2888]
MDIVLGVSMAPETVRMVLVEGMGAGGVTVDQDDFAVTGGAAVDAERVIAAIVGTRESAVEGGNQLVSSGVAFTDRAEAAALRDALAAHKIENVMLVSAFMAAAALAQAVGSATNCARTALLFVEPANATLAVVDSSAGSIVDVRRRPLPDGDDAALAQLTAMVSGAESMKARPDGVFVVGSGVDIPSIKPTLEAATSLSVTAPEEPDMALARGAALASANAHLGAPSTAALPDADPGGSGLAGLAYSDVADDGGTAAESEAGGRRSRKALVAIAAAVVVFVGGAVALTLALAFGIRPHVEQRPDVGKSVVAPAPAPPPSAGPGPETAAPPRDSPPPDPRPRDRVDDWLHRHLGHGIPGP